MQHSKRQTGRRSFSELAAGKLQKPSARANRVDVLVDSVSRLADLLLTFKARLTGKTISRVIFIWSVLGQTKVKYTYWFIFISYVSRQVWIDVFGEFTPTGRFLTLTCQITRPSLVWSQQTLNADWSKPSWARPTSETDSRLTPELGRDISKNPVRQSSTTNKRWKYKEMLRKVWIGIPSEMSRWQGKRQISVVTSLTVRLCEVVFWRMVLLYLMYSAICKNSFSDDRKAKKNLCRDNRWAHFVLQEIPC